MTARRPTLAASMIVRDEEDHLADCLASLDGVVDEVVVYDTGSTDRTRDMAREAGATVVEGYWDDDFARARNAALAHTDAEWVLWIDADHRLTARRSKLRRLIERDADVYLVQIDDVMLGGRTTFSHSSPRLFRPARAHFQGAIHEQVVARRTGETPALRRLTAPAAAIRLTHVGMSNVDALHTKGERNAKVARKELDALLASGSDDPHAAAKVALDLGRGLALAGRPQEAVDALETVRSLVPAGDLVAQLATETLINVLQIAGQLDIARHLIEELRVNGVDDGYCDFRLARIDLQQGQPLVALHRLQGTHRLVAPGRLEHDAGLIDQLRSDALQRLRAEHGDEAVAVALSAVIAGHGAVDLVPLLLDVAGSVRPDDIATGLAAHGSDHRPAIVARLRQAGQRGRAVAVALTAATNGNEAADVA